MFDPGFSSFLISGFTVGNIGAEVSGTGLPMSAERRSFSEYFSESPMLTFWS